MISENVHRDHGARLAAIAPEARWLRLQDDGSLVLDGGSVEAAAVAPDAAFISNDSFARADVNVAALTFVHRFGAGLTLRNRTVVAPNAMYVIVSNPVDVLTYVFNKVTSIPESHIIGTGTLLDTARLRSRLSDYLNVSQQNIHASTYRLCEPCAWHSTVARYSNHGRPKRR